MTFLSMTSRHEYKTKRDTICLELLLEDVLDTILCAENNNSATKEYTSIHSQIIEISVNLDPNLNVQFSYYIASYNDKCFIFYSDKRKRVTKKQTNKKK